MLASSVQVISGHAFRDRAVKEEDGPAPTNHYAMTKAWAELTGDMYARVHKLSVISVRIGWVPRNNGEAQRLIASPQGKAIFFSHNDSNRFHALCVESPNPAPGTSVVLQATSRPTGPARMSIERARQVIGYEPQDIWPEGLPYAVEPPG